MGSKMKKAQKEGQDSIHLEIPEPQPGRNGPPTTHWGSFMFQPGIEYTDPTPTGSNDSSGRQRKSRAPEKKLTLFALRLAVLEKTASGLGKLAFVWASIVLLGGFAVILKSTDFVLVTVILLIEGTRIFSRSHELEWQHQATKTPAGLYSLRHLISSSRSLIQNINLLFKPPLVAKSSGSASRRISEDIRVTQQQQAAQIATKYPGRQRTWHTSNVPLVPNFGWVFVSRNVSRILVWLQILSATACIALSLMRLIQHDYGEVTDSDRKNRKPALIIFYALALAEALFFLLEKTYWEWKVTYCNLLEQVCKECDLWELYGLLPIERFFYDAYFSCINGSVFDGLKMDLVSFAKDLLDSDFKDEQLIGVRILHKFSTNREFSNDTLRKIGSSTSVIERLIAMVSWRKSDEEEIRRSAAEIIAKLAGKNHNALRVASIIGAMESISSLLYTGRRLDAEPQEIYPRSIITDQDYAYSDFNQLGLMILKKLASDHDNCGKIGSSRGLLAKVIDFTSAGQSLLRNDLAPESQIKQVRRSLQLVKSLVSTTGNTGKILRKDISEIVFTVSNIRDILEYGENHMVLQKLAVEILMSLAMDEDAREKIGSTGGVIKLLLQIFFRPRLTKDQDTLSIEAGETLAMLALESKSNCTRMLRVEKVVEQLVGTLNDTKLRVNSSRILRNVCAYAGTECYKRGTECYKRLEGVTAAAPTLLKTIMTEKDKLLEVSVGLTTQTLRFISPVEFDKELTGAGTRDTDFAEKLVEILKAQNYPQIKVPRMRLFIIELSIQMMNYQNKYITIFKKMSLEEVLDSVAETTSEIESFHVFSGSVGISRHKTSICSLVDTALELMNKG